MDQPQRAPLVNLRRVVISLLLAVAAAGFWLAGSQTRSEDAPVQRDSAVEATFPGEAELDLRQARIGLDLVSGYRADISVDGVPIPEDELQRVESLGIVYYLPAPERATGALEPGRHCASAVLWQPTRGSADDVGRRFSWCFNLH